MAGDGFPELDEEEGEVQPRSRILVVDDEPDIRSALKSLLRATYEVDVFADPADAVHAVSEDYDAAIVDIKMEPRNGFWVYDEIRSKLPELPIIFHSAYQDTSQDSALSGRYMPFAYLPKGGDVKGLIDTISRAVDKHRQMREQRAAMQRVRSQMRNLR